MKILNIFQKAIEDVRDQAQSAQDELSRLKARRKELTTLAMPREEFIRAVCACIDKKADTWQNDSLPLTLAPFIANPDAVLNVNILEANGSYADIDRVFPGSLYALLAPELKAALRKRIEAMPWPREVGPSRADRVAELARIDAEIAELETGLKKLHAEARTVGAELAKSVNTP